MKPLILKHLWVLPQLENQGSSASSAGDWKLIFKITFQRISKSLYPFLLAQFQHLSNSTQVSLATSSLQTWIFSPSTVNTHIFISPACVRSTTAKIKLQNLNGILHTSLYCEIHPCARLYLNSDVNGTCENHLPRHEFYTINTNISHFMEQYSIDHIPPLISGEKTEL